MHFLVLKMLIFPVWSKIGIHECRTPMWHSAYGITFGLQFQDFNNNN